MKHRISRWIAGVVAVMAVMGLSLSSHTPVVGVSTAAAQNVTVAPTRVVMEERDRSEELVLVNRGTDPVTYRISLIGMKMTDEGRLERIEEPEEGQNFAHDLLRFAPRQVRIEPGGAQRVRLSVRRPPDLEEGEYRSHMLFQAVPDADDNVDVDTGDDELALRLNVISGISIATIVRHGDLSVDVEIDDIELVRAEDELQQDELKFRLHRSGERSVYGQVKVDYIPDGAGEDDDERITIGRRGGTAVYTPNDGRNVEVPLNLPDDISLDDGRILVTYEEDGTDEPMTTGELQLQ